MKLIFKLLNKYDVLPLCNYDQTWLCPLCAVVPYATLSIMFRCPLRTVCPLSSVVHYLPLSLLWRFCPLCAVVSYVLLSLMWHCPLCAFVPYVPLCLMCCCHLCALVTYVLLSLICRRTLCDVVPCGKQQLWRLFLFWSLKILETILAIVATALSIKYLRYNYLFPLCQLKTCKYADISLRWSTCFWID
jgi:hypothetical protein